MKTCTKCKTTLNESQFNKNKTRKDGLHSSCKKCNSIYLKSHYELNKDYYIDKAHKQMDIVRVWVKTLKIGKSCIQCGESHPSCLQYHHRNPETKKFCISMAVSQGFGKKAILREIEKCDILCANCHFKLHYNGEVV